MRVLLIFLVTHASAVPSPVTELNAEAYLGRWYQVYASFNVKYTFELGGNCVTADYGSTSLNQPQVVSVLNTVRLLPSYRWLPSSFRNVEINGFAAQTSDGTVPGAFTVSLGPFVGSASSASFDPPGNYWIVKLGPIVEHKYSYAVISNADADQLYVLTRDPEKFKTNDENGVLQWLKEEGFTGFWNRPRATNQDGCNYSKE